LPYNNVQFNQALFNTYLLFPFFKENNIYTNIRIYLDKTFSTKLSIIPHNAILINRIFLKMDIVRNL
jgi:hypothetical protein